MPQRTFLNSNTECKSNMGTVLKTVLAIIVLFAAFGAGYFTANRGYKVVDSAGTPVVSNGNAAQIVKEENARLAREVIGKSEADAENLLRSNHRTMFVGMRDNELYEYKGQKTFTNLTVSVMNGKVTKVLGWY